MKSVFRFFLTYVDIILCFVKNFQKQTAACKDQHLPHNLSQLCYWLTILLISIFLIYNLKKLNADICDEMLELYGGGKKKEKTEVSDEGSSSNHSSPMPSSSPPAKKRVRQVYCETWKYLWDVIV